MAVNLSSLILRVQAVLSDLPSSYASDEQIYTDLKSAKIYFDSIKRTDYDDDIFEEEALVRLGSYFTYVNYTSLAERQLGTIPQTTDVKLQSLRKLALAFLRNICDFKINDDLSIDKKAESECYTVASVVSPSVFSD